MIFLIKAGVFPMRNRTAFVMLSVVGTLCGPDTGCSSDFFLDDVVDGGSDWTDSDPNLEKEPGTDNEEPDGVVPDQKLCTTSDNFDDFAPAACEVQAPAGSFDPRMEWSWSAPRKKADWLLDAWGPPLVANMTDDNGDGRIDMCDTPDVIVVAGGPEFDLMESFPDVFSNYVPPMPIPIIHVIDGATGKTHYSIDELRPDGLPMYALNPYTTPAVGDIDGDGRPEIVVPQAAMSIAFDNGIFTNALSLLRVNAKDKPGLLAFEDDGTLKWSTKVSEAVFINTSGCLGVNLADLDGDGKVEIIAGVGVFDSKDGSLKWSNAGELASRMGALSLATIVADLDMDGFLDVVTGNYGFDRDGNMMYDRSDLIQPRSTSVMDFMATRANLIGVIPLVANFDDDPEPEVIISGGRGIFMLDPPDYKTKFKYNHGLASSDPSKFGPATVADFNGDGRPQIGIGTSVGFALLNHRLEEMWVADTSIPAKNAPGILTTSQEMVDKVLLTGSTAFDFLGDGTAEAIYADRYSMLVLDGKTGDVVMGWPRMAGQDFPVVADVDNDQSAEIVFANIVKETAEQPLPSVVVLGDEKDRWVPTRRIWNMGSYHVTNILEDSRIPMRKPPNWETLNTFRTNVQMEADGVCTPVSGK